MAKQPTDEGAEAQARHTGLTLDIHDLVGNEQLYELFSKKISDDVFDRYAVQKEQDFSKRLQLWGIVSVVAIAALYVAHTAIVEDQANTAVQGRIQELEEKFTAAGLNLQISELVNSIDAGDSFSLQEEQAVMQLLQDGSALNAVTRRPTFAVRLEQFINALYGAGRNAQVDLIERLYRDFISSKPGVIATLVQHYGRRLLETPGAPDDWDFSEDGTFELYRRYADLANQNNYPEAYLLHELLIRHSLADETSQRMMPELIRELGD